MLLETSPRSLRALAFPLAMTSPFGSTSMVRAFPLKLPFSASRAQDAIRHSARFRLGVAPQGCRIRSYGFSATCAKEHSSSGGSSVGYLPHIGQLPQRDGSCFPAYCDAEFTLH